LDVRNSDRSAGTSGTSAMAAAVAAVLASSSAGCAGPRIALGQLDDPSALEITLDSNARAVRPGGPVLRFYVDIRNRGKRRVDLSELDIELTASPAGRRDLVALRKSWGYRQPRAITVEPGGVATFPITPETITYRLPEHLSADLGVGLGSDVVTVSEFPLATLAPGTYEIRAIVAERWISAPYEIGVVQPDWGARTERLWPEARAPRGP